MEVLMTGPSKMDHGGVASYCNTVIPYLNKCLDNRINYIEIGSTKKNKGILYPLVDQISFFRQISRHKPTVVHVNPSLNLKSFFRDGLIIYQAKLRKLPILVFFHGWEETFEKHIEKNCKWFFNHTYRQADSFVVLSSKFREKLKEWGVKAPIHLSTTTVPDELLENFVMKKKMLEIETAPFIKILFMARLEREKGIFETLEAVRTLLNRGAKVSLTVAGDGPVIGEVKDWLDARKISSDQISVEGYVKGEEKKALLCSHHLYCFPTYYGEGMPTSIIEAMAFGMPVVTCKKGGIGDFFINGKMGILLEKPEVSSIVDSLESLLENRNKLAAIGHYNYEYAKLHFRASDIAEKLSGLYLKLDNSS